jgi:expansin (peptidoglycan-binding protein)
MRLRSKISRTGLFFFYAALIHLGAWAQTQNDCAPIQTFRGEGTYYGATGAGNCSFDPTPQDLMVAAMNAPQYANSAVCGACVRVKGPKGSVEVRIVDQCPECKFGDLDFSLEAFVKIADQVAGRVPIEWQYIPCPVNGPIAFKYKEGSSQWWIGIQVRNHRYAIQKLEYRKRDGSFAVIPRESYNYFVAQSGIDEDKQKTGPYHFRITDINNQIVEEPNIPFNQNQIINGRLQFPFCRPNPVGIASLEKESNQDWVAFPNPFTKTLKLIPIKKATAAAYTAQLYDLQGRLLWRQNIEELAEGYELPFVFLPAGVYELCLAEESVPAYRFRIVKLDSSD